MNITGKESWNFIKATALIDLKRKRFITFLVFLKKELKMYFSEYAVSEDLMVTSISICHVKQVAKC